MPVLPRARPRGGLTTGCAAGSLLLQFLLFVQFAVNKFVSVAPHLAFWPYVHFCSHDAAIRESLRD